MVAKQMPEPLLNKSNLGPSKARPVTVPSKCAHLDGNSNFSKKKKYIQIKGEVSNN